MTGVENQQHEDLTWKSQTHVNRGLITLTVVQTDLVRGSMLVNHKRIVLPADNHATLFGYRRHPTEVRKTLVSLLKEAVARLPVSELRSAITGSGSLSTAQAARIPFCARSCCLD